MGPRVPTEIVEAARAGDPADIERLLETVWVDAYRLAMSITAQAQSAEDAAQDACVVMFRGISSLRNREDSRRTRGHRTISIDDGAAQAAAASQGTRHTRSDERRGSPCTLTSWKEAARCAT